MELGVSAVHTLYMPKKDKDAPKPKHYLRRWRKHRGYSLEAASAEIGITHASLSRIERGKQDYTQEYLEALAWLYKCTPSDLLSLDPTLRQAA